MMISFVDNRAADPLPSSPWLGNATVEPSLRPVAATWPVESRASRDSPIVRDESIDYGTLRKVLRDCAGLVEKARFEALARQWRQETRFISNVTTKAMHPAYQSIIGMGDVAIPLILSDLVNNGPADWFWALHFITGANPLADELAGNVRAMTEAWITWGRNAGYLNDSPKKMKPASLN